MSFNTAHILVIGLGLIGGSFAQAARRLTKVQRVVGFDLNREECELGLALGVIDAIAEDLETEVRQADLVMLAVPVKAIELVLAQIAPWLKPNALITDVGSTKANVIEAAERIWKPLPPGFVPGHPIAGAEKSGVAAADAALFIQRKVILTPLANTPEAARLALARLWQSLGAEVLQMDPVRHDEVLAATSHLPHLLAFSLADTLAVEAESTDIFRYAAGGFRDFTRIAASDPVMWHDVCIANRDPILAQIDRFSAGLAQMREAIALADGQRLTGIFTRARASREQFSRILERAGYLNDSVEPQTFKVDPAGSLSGHLRVPGDRSISHRAIMLAAIAEGVSDIEGFVESEDSLATIQVFRDLGVVIEGPHQGRVRVYGAGLDGLQPASGALYFGNSGTSLRMLLGLLAAQPFDTEITVSSAFIDYNFSEVIEPLEQMGAKFELSNIGMPIKVYGGQKLSGIKYAPEFSSSQVKAALILAAMTSAVQMDLFESNTTRDHTERLLHGFGVDLIRDGRSLTLASGAKLIAQGIQIPADLSFATAFVVAASVVPGSDLVIEHTGVNPTRQQTLRMLARMGVVLEFTNEGSSNGEPIADLRVSSAPLVGIDCTSTELAGVGDELPLVLVAMSCATGCSELIGVDRLPERHAQLLDNFLHQLESLGVGVERQGKDIKITPATAKSYVEVDAGEHPIAGLALMILALVSSEGLSVRGCRALTSVFPEYLEQARRIGIKLMRES